MKVAVVVLSFNSKSYIDDCLTSLQHLKTTAKVEIVIVDSGSTDGSAAYIRKKYPLLTLFASSKNLGYAGGNNLGLRYALDHSADFVWIVNPDIVVDKQALTYVLKTMSDPAAGAAASKVYFAKGFEFHKQRYTPKDLGHVLWYAGGHNDWQNVFALHEGINRTDHGQYDSTRQVDFATGSSFFIRSAVLRQVGLIDEKYFLYYEENDLCQRILRHGWKIMYAPQSIVWHKVGQAAGIGSPLADYYTTRNRLLFGLRWAPLRTKLALVKESFRLMFTGRKWQKMGVLDFYLGRFGQGSYVN